MNVPCTFTENVEIFGDDINCNLSDIVDKLLFCFAKYEKYFYAASSEDLYQILTGSCRCIGCTASGCPEGGKCSVTTNQNTSNMLHNEL